MVSGGRFKFSKMCLGSALDDSDSFGNAIAKEVFRPTDPIYDRYDNQCGNNNCEEWSH